MWKAGGTFIVYTWYLYGFLARHSHKVFFSSKRECDNLELKTTYELQEINPATKLPRNKVAAKCARA
jgi:hypothetical protein